MTIHYLVNGEIDYVKTEAREIDGGIEGPGMFEDDANAMCGLMTMTDEAIALFTQPGIERPRLEWDIDELTGDAA